MRLSRGHRLVASTLALTLLAAFVGHPIDAAAAGIAMVPAASDGGVSFTVGAIIGITVTTVAIGLILLIRTFHNRTDRLDD